MIISVGHKMKRWLSFARLRAVMTKEFIQMRRDRITFAMMVGIPLVQLILFGYAINSDPKNLPTLVEVNDDAPVIRSILAGMQASGYFKIEGLVSGEEDAQRALRDGSANFVLVFPPHFERDLLRGQKPEILLEADASDPTATASALAAIGPVVEQAVGQSFDGVLARQKNHSNYDIVVHRYYNPEAKSSINIVPGLLGVIMTMTMVMITSMAIVREYERGTMESLIATPVRPFEVMFGKITPYVIVGYVQTALFLVAARMLFDVPFMGSKFAFFVGLNLFIITNLAIGFLISTLARTQMQAMQLSVFNFLPSILLSGFMFPFAGMPQWAQFIGNCLPTTHFISFTRKVMLKSAVWADIQGEVLALSIIMIVVSLFALTRYHQTLD